jgi:hypothetical protein
LDDNTGDDNTGATGVDCNGTVSRIVRAVGGGIDELIGELIGDKFVT